MPDASPRHPATAKSFKWHVQRVFESAYLEVVVGVMVVISVAVHPQGGSMKINPKEHRFEADDDVVVIAEKEPNFS